MRQERTAQCSSGSFLQGGCLTAVYRNMPDRTDQHTFLSLIFKTSVKNVCPSLGASLIKDSSMNLNKNLGLKFFVRFLTFY